MSPRVVFIADTLDNASLFKDLLSELQAEVTAGSTMQIGKLLRAGNNPDLIIFEARGLARSHLERVLRVSENCEAALLLIVDESDFAQMPMPSSVKSDFVVHGAKRPECVARVRRLLGEHPASARVNTLSVDGMEMNLDTYQVSVFGKPIDFTYLEYVLLAFLVQHPNRVFSREMLLQRVWGTDYFGGSRTVDVHVRRIRAKIGPKLAQHLETVRSVGYLWNSE